MPGKFVINEVAIRIRINKMADVDKHSDYTKYRRWNELTYLGSLLLGVLNGSFETHS